MRDDVKWTEGPWDLEYGDASHRYVHVTDANDRTVHYKYASAGPTEANQDIANARLIAAAPDLYEALAKSAVGWANAIELGLIPPKHVAAATVLRDEARAALSRAQGASNV